MKTRFQSNALRGRVSTQRRRFRGGAVLEAALVFPILLSLTFGTVEFGYYFYVKHSLQGAAREGARAGIVPTATNTDVTTAVSNALAAAGLSASGYTTAISPTNVSGQTAGTPIQVTVTCVWGTVGKVYRPLALIDSTKQVTGVTVMRKEG